jgi:hypothetical protein
MKIDDLLPFAEQFATVLRPLNASILVAPPIRARDFFIHCYQDEIPMGTGAYIIYTDDDVLYIGKTKRADKRFNRIWAHTKAAKVSATGQKAFSDAPLAYKAKIIAAGLQPTILAGQFRIDYVPIRPDNLADGLEVFMQSVYFAAMDRLPYGNDQFG